MANFQVSKLKNGRVTWCADTPSLTIFGGKRKVHRSSGRSDGQVDSFLTALKFLIMLFLGARWLRLPLQIPKMVSESEIGPRGAKRRLSEKSKILANLECGNRTFNLSPTFSKIIKRTKLKWILPVHDRRAF